MGSADDFKGKDYRKCGRRKINLQGFTQNFTHKPSQKPTASTAQAHTIVLAIHAAFLVSFTSFAYMV